MGEHRGKPRLRMGGPLRLFRRDRPWRAWPGCKVRANKRRAPMVRLLAKRELRAA